MSFKSRSKFVLLAATAINLGVATPAWAQPSEPAAPDAAATSDDEEIIVTARRFDENLQDVPISMTVFNQEALDKHNVFSAKDLAVYTPSLSVNTRFGNDVSSFSIRGFSQELRTSASVGTYFADVVAPRGGGSTQGGDGAGPGAFFDLQNVQVLKGPQGTLFGRNTTGGAVLLVPKKPTTELEGYVEGSIGNYDMRRLQGVINIPLADTLRIRAGVDWQERDGFLKNISGIGPKDFGDVDYFSARLSIVADLTPDLENYTVASYSKSTPNGNIPKSTNCVPLQFPFGVLACQQMAREAGQGWNAVSNSLPDATQQIEQWQIINTTTWQASDNLTIKNIVSYAELRNLQRLDLFGQAWVLPPVLSNAAGTINIPTGIHAGKVLNLFTSKSLPGGYNAAQSTFTEELQFQGKFADGRLVWQAGVYFELSDPLGFSGVQNPSRLACTDSDTFQCTDPLRLLLGAAAAGSMGYQAVKTQFRDIGLYAQASYDLTEQLKLTGGIRYTWDRSRSVADSVTYRFVTPNAPPVGTCNNPLVRPANMPISSLNSQSQCREFFEQKSSAPTWLLGLDFKPSDDLLLYAKWARGYRQGSTNPFGPTGVNTFEQEKVDTYEAGAKASFQGAVSGTFNIAAFYSDFSDQQLNAAYRNSLALFPPAPGIVNIGKSRIYGFEIETVIRPFEGFTIQGSYAYLNTKITKLTAIPPSPNYNILSHLSTEGGPLLYTPKHKLSLSAQYVLPLDESIGKITFGVNYTYNGKMFYQTTDPASLATLVLIGAADVVNIPAYDLWDMNISWNNIGQTNIDAQFFMTNIANKHYFLARNIQPALGTVSRYLAEPRIMGFKLRYNF